MVSFEIFVKAMPPSLSELKVKPIFCFPIKIRDDPTASSIYLTSLFTILADTPHVSDCSELERLGINQNGYYYIDPSGQRQNSELSLAYCDNDGWTHILKREHDPSLTYVS